MAQCFPTVQRRAATRQECEWKCIIPYCEKSGASLEQLGKYYKSVKVPQDVQPICGVAAEEYP